MVGAQHLRRLCAWSSSAAPVPAWSRRGTTSPACGSPDDKYSRQVLHGDMLLGTGRAPNARVALFRCLQQSL